ncbi:MULTISPECIES: hypothetical protein [unclassified Coleofasciculus]|uniref:hypothetical protein n=1 Tax=unclassified Coleofasciculus TaxID=2692782 RepID=UPI001880E5E0|nr:MULTISPECIES: hypothetical protein [unclassified Coleofasciculus]MBE9125015.1 hypothetical protein [Coleofasciculus sp. LEGE 07081]MBE9147665.1 hypothetical protein [Coleofasciculus sp. LEGE 07092]
MSEKKPNSRKPIWVNLALLGLLLMSGGFTLTACGQSRQEGESTEQDVNNQSVEQDQAEDADQKVSDPKTEKERKYEAEGVDTIEDDDPE